jgi:steroid delta-isomerase-like uncharacterized protein
LQAHVLRSNVAEESANNRKELIMPDDPKKLLRRFYDGVSSGDLSIIDELLADDLVEHERFPGIESNKAGVKQIFAIYRSAFPDLHIEAHEMLTEGDLACARITSTGTHQGEFMGMPATGKRIEVDSIDIVRFRDGQAVEHWGITDVKTMMQQLGAIPEPPGS